MTRLGSVRREGEGLRLWRECQNLTDYNPPKFLQMPLKFQATISNTYQVPPETTVSDKDLRMPEDMDVVASLKLLLKEEAFHHDGGMPSDSRSLDAAVVRSSARSLIASPEAVRYPRSSRMAGCTCNVPICS